MGVTVVVGGQYGSEGKGKVCAHLALTGQPAYMVRSGGPNAGHTVYQDGVKYQLRQVPAGFVNPKTRLLIAPGALVVPDILLEEIKVCGLDPSRIGIDRNAGIIDPDDRVTEQQAGLTFRLGSTGSGTGAAASRRAIRDPGFRTAQQVPSLTPYLTEVPEELNIALRANEHVVVEGTQGFGLSVHHYREWPYCTSRDTIAHAFLADAGIGAKDYQVIMAVRTHPIRVHGNSGPLKNEISWEQVQKESGYPYPIAEYTTTTNRLRRVAKFDPDIISKAAQANGPTQIALHGADYLDYENLGTTHWEQLTDRAKLFTTKLAELTQAPVTIIGTGPLQEHLIERKNEG